MSNIDRKLKSAVIDFMFDGAGTAMLLDLGLLKSRATAQIVCRTENDIQLAVEALMDQRVVADESASKNDLILFNETEQYFSDYKETTAMNILDAIKSGQKMFMYSGEFHFGFTVRCIFEEDSGYELHSDEDFSWAVEIVNTIKDESGHAARPFILSEDEFSSRMVIPLSNIDTFDQLINAITNVKIRAQFALFQESQKFTIAKSYLIEKMTQSIKSYMAQGGKDFFDEISEEFSTVIKVVYEGYELRLHSKRNEQEQGQIHLSDEAWNHLEEMLDNPAKATPELKELIGD